MKTSNQLLLLLLAVSLGLTACTGSITDVEESDNNTLAAQTSLEVSDVVAKAPAPGNGVLNIVHGIPATEVDVCATGPATGGEWAKIIPGFNFTEYETLEIAAGDYDANVVLAGDACDQPILSATGVTLEEGANASVVAHLTEAGAPTLAVFVNDPMKNGKGTLAAHHTAQAPPVDVWVGRNTARLAVAIEDFTNGQQVEAPFQPGRRDLALSLPDDSNVIYGPISLVLKANRYYAAYAVGTFPDTFTFVVVPIKAY